MISMTLFRSLLPPFFSFPTSPLYPLPLQKSPNNPHLGTIFLRLKDIKDKYVEYVNDFDRSARTYKDALSLKGSQVPATLLFHPGLHFPGKVWPICRECCPENGSSIPSYYARTGLSYLFTLPPPFSYYLAHASL